jgi:hypothetical protein
MTDIWASKSLVPTDQGNYYHNHQNRTLHYVYHSKKVTGKAETADRQRIQLNTSVNFKVKQTNALVSIMQCSESVSFWASRIGLSEVWIRIILSSGNSKKNVYFYCFLTFLGLFIYEERSKCIYKK